MQSGALTADEYTVEKGRLLELQSASTPADKPEIMPSRGWHPDPHDPWMKRFYNGYQWTDKRRQYHFWESKSQRR
jgi:hypothetical protein